MDNARKKRKQGLILESFNSLPKKESLLDEKYLF